MIDAPQQPGYIRTPDGVSLFYRDWGSGTPLVFLSGWTLNSSMWAYQMQPLSEQEMRCIAYDRRAHGRSSDPGRGYDFDTLADDLACVIETLGLSGIAIFHSQEKAQSRYRAVRPKSGVARLRRWLHSNHSRTSLTIRP